MALTYTLHRDCYHQLADAAGQWDIEGGKVFDAHKKEVATYSCTKRTSCGSMAQKASQLWLTLFFTPKFPPENMTLHGADEWDAPHNACGSVSAASPAWTAEIGHTFTLVGNVLKIA